MRSLAPTSAGVTLRCAGRSRRRTVEAKAGNPKKKSNEDNEKKDKKEKKTTVPIEQAAAAVAHAAAGHVAVNGQEDVGKGEKNGDGGPPAFPQPSPEALAAAAKHSPETSEQRRAGFDATKPVHVTLTPGILEKVAERAQQEYIYEHSLGQLQIELVKLQESVKANGDKVCIIFEGRDAAGKGGVIARIASALSPRICRIAALPAPTEKEKTQWYFQRYAAQLPSAGEIVLFDRSWYNRAGVEKVMGFCTDEQYELFLLEAPHFERSIVSSGTTLLKFYLNIEDTVQEQRFQDRLRRSWKRWKLSPMDLFARSRWTEYSRARDVMLARTDHSHGRWHVLDSNDKQCCQLNAISFILATVPYDEVELPLLDLPPRESVKGYDPPPATAWNYVPTVYSPAMLAVPPHIVLQAASLQVVKDAKAVKKEEVAEEPASWSAFV